MREGRRGGRGLLTDEQKRCLDSAPRIETGRGLDALGPQSVGSSKLSSLNVPGARGLYREAWERVRNAPKVGFRGKIDREQAGWDVLKPAQRLAHFPELLDASEAVIVVSYSVYAVDGEVFLRGGTATTVEFSCVRYARRPLPNPREELFHERAEEVVAGMQERLEERDGLEPLKLRIRRDEELRDAEYMLGLVGTIEEHAGRFSLGETGRIVDLLGALRGELELYGAEMAGTEGPRIHGRASWGNGEKAKGG